MIKIEKTIAAILLAIILCTPHFSIASEITSNQIQDQEQEEKTPEEEIEEARQKIADYAVEFASKGYTCVYPKGTDAEVYALRGKTYRTKDTPDKEYIFECVGFVSFIINRSIGIDFELARLGSSGFVTGKNVRDTTHFTKASISSNSIEPGDILMNPNGDTHVAIYVGQENGVDYVVDMWTSGCAKRSIYRDGDGYRMHGFTSCKFINFARLTSLDGAYYTPIEGGADLPSGEITADTVDLDEIADKYDFDGMPSGMTKQEDVDIFKWLFDGFAGFFDYLAGLIISIIKAPILGFVSLFERLINSMLYDLNT